MTHRFFRLRGAADLRGGPQGQVQPTARRRQASRPSGGAGAAALALGPERARQLLATLLALALLSTLLGTGAGQAEAQTVEECKIVHPTDGYVFEADERQEIRTNCVGPLLYSANLEFRNAMTGDLVDQGQTIPSTSGLDSSTLSLPLLGGLPAGSWTVRADFTNGMTDTVTFGVASLIETISATCDGFPFFDGFYNANRWQDDRTGTAAQGGDPGAYLRVRYGASYDSDSSLTVHHICTRGGFDHVWGALDALGGRLDILPASGESLPEAELSVGPCIGLDDGVLPRPITGGRIAPDDPDLATSWLVDLRRAENQVAVCVRIDSAKLGNFEASVTIPAPASAIGDIRFIPDQLSSDGEPTPRPPWPNVPSGRCWNDDLSQYEGSYNYAIKHVDAAILGAEVRLAQLNGPTILNGYPTWSGTDDAHLLCGRVNWGSTAGGLVTGFTNLSEGSQPEWDTNPPPPGGGNSPCQTVLTDGTVLGVPYGLYHGTAPADGAPAACLRAAGFGADVIMRASGASAQPVLDTD